MSCPALQFLILTVSGWLSDQQLAMVEYLLEENRVLREQLDGRWLRLTDAQRRRLAVKGKVLGRKALAEFARNLTDIDARFLPDGYYVIHDRDPLYTKEFLSILEAGGVTPVRLPPKSPNLNAFAERFVRSIKEECLDRVVPLGERHLRAVVNDYIVHYHEERNHQGLDNRRILPRPESTAKLSSVKRRERVGGMLNYYHRAAA